MANIATSLVDLIGNTPLLHMGNFGAKEGLAANILAKVEFFNPSGSIKDRVAYALIVNGEESGKIDSETVIIEPTSGNTGIGLAFVCAIKGYRLILTMPETMSIERRSVLAALGAEIVLTPAAEGMSGSIKKAEELAAQYPKAFIPGQFDNPANPQAHRDTTARELLRDTDCNIDILVAGVGTGGTLTGLGEVLKSAIPHVQIVAVEPADSPVLSGGKPGPHGLQGIGAGFVPNTLNTDIIDLVMPITTEEAYLYARKAAATEGLLIGISGGAALAAASALAGKEENRGKNIVVILPDTGDRYLSTPLFSSK